jgi:hypothetical protein
VPATNENRLRSVISNDGVIIPRSVDILRILLVLEVDHVRDVDNGTILALIPKSCLLRRGMRWRRRLMLRLRSAKRRRGLARGRRQPPRTEIVLVVHTRRIADL